MVLTGMSVDKQDNGKGSGVSRLQDSVPISRTTTRGQACRAYSADVGLTGLSSDKQDNDKVAGVSRLQR